MPNFSVRLDPLNWLLYGQLYLELEFDTFDWLTVETVPMFVVSEQPVVFNQVDELEQSSGMGPIAGASIGLGFWLDGDSFRGTVIRTGLTFYDIDYQTRALSDFAGDNAGAFDPVDRGEVMDSLTHKQRRLSVILGSQRQWGIFTVAGGFGVEYELREDRRCLIREDPDDDNSPFAVSRTSQCDDEELNIATSPLGRDSISSLNIFDAWHPVYLTARLSLGVVFDD